MSTDNPPPATNVAGRGRAAPQQLDAGNYLPQSTRHSFLYLSFFCLLELQSRSHFVSLLCPLESPEMEHMDVDAVIEEIAKDAVAEADGIAANEAAKDVTTEADKTAADEAAKAAQEEAANESA